MLSCSGNKKQQERGRSFSVVSAGSSTGGHERLAGAEDGLRGAAAAFPECRQCPFRGLRLTLEAAPLPHHLLIRVSLKDWEEVQKFQQELLDARHYDAAYVFRKLRVDKAFYFTAMPKLLSFRTKKNMDSSTETKQEFKGPDDRVAGLSTADCLEEMQNVHDHYQKMKCLISMDQSQPDKALNLIKDDFVTNFRDIISEYQQWQKNKVESPFITAGEEAMKAKEGSSRESEGSERARALADIKFKSYSAVAQASKSRRHRQVKLESSEYESDHRKSPRGKRARKRLQPVRRKETQQNRGALQAIKEEGVGRILSMPVITEDEEDDDAEEDHHSSDEAFVPFKRKRTR
ncbi:snRNA-activating protein complex subunit 1 isoform X3 [Hemicordylus capensis]|uniref:snRNA-activating protein complex subunit 1 isoform X3 n=1 Tax=Hemicordylus capensis TaxID=884348 RepID=UPI002303C03C|nr:snRNA-activating protein complex subunit 1 isoform X3 [Hemicordylus capensis]